METGPVAGRLVSRYDHETMGKVQKLHTLKTIIYGQNIKFRFLSICKKGKI
jgi:hypothetical protein